MSQLQNVLGNLLRKAKTKKTISISTTKESQEFNFEPIKLSIQLPCSHKRRKSINHISLQITIDDTRDSDEEQFKNEDLLRISTKAFSSQSSSSSSSGYSSCASSTIDYKQDEHVYDKLNYSIKRRHSLSSSSTNDYEEISNFTTINSQTNEIDEDTYEHLYDYRSSVVKKIPRLNNDNHGNIKLKSILKKKTTQQQQHENKNNNIIRKHEYSINEIFQNLNSFKKQAKEQQQQQHKQKQEKHLYVNDRFNV
jgi:hypothetical protein